MGFRRPTLEEVQRARLHWNRVIERHQDKQTKYDSMPRHQEKQIKYDSMPSRSLLQRPKLHWNKVIEQHQKKPLECISGPSGVLVEGHISMEQAR